MFSLKGSPGVTTLSCLLAATWPDPAPVVVVEADPAGGDLAARFGLSSTMGWSSLEAAVRRGGAASPLEPHLQQLPGGLAVLVGAHAVTRCRTAMTPGWASCGGTRAPSWSTSVA